MKTLFTLLFLLGSFHSFAQFGLTLTCPDPITVACIDAIPAPDLAEILVQTDCGLDFNGNPIDISSSGGTVSSCDTTYIACYSATAVNVYILDNGNTRVEIEITYGSQAGCKHAISHVAFGLPDGVRAVEFNEQDSYTGLLGSYNVENTTNNPYYSIKFESNGDGFGPGTREVFVYTLPAGVSYEEVDILIKAATSSDTMTLSLGCQSGPSTSTDTIINYETYWIYDYIEPGGTGCIGDPIIVTRSFGARDACYNSSSCFQEFYIESECVDGVPVGCESDTTTIALDRTTLPSNNVWQPMQGRYAITFSGYEEHQGGYYSITKIWQPEGRESLEEDREIGRMAPLWQKVYEFAHESIDLTDSIRVEWVGTANAISGNSTSYIQEAGVYPNPGVDAFTVTIPADLQGNGQVVVFDQLGRQQQQLSVSQDDTSIQLNGADWGAGIYRVQVIDDAGSVYQATWVKR